MIEENTISGGEFHGIEVTEGLTVTNNGMVIKYNTITDNTGDGIKIGTSTGVVVNFNNIEDNTDGVTSSVGKVDAENNWWGNASGPADTSVEPTAYGDSALTADVDYEPWLLAVVVPPTTPTTYEKTLADGTSFPQVTLATYLTSVDAYYIKTDGGGGVGINYSTSSPGVVTKTLVAGWDIISCAGETDAYTVLSQLQHVQIGEQEGVGLTSLVGQGNYNQFTDSISLTLVTTDEWLDIKSGNGGTPVPLSAFDGFWVYMNAAKSFGVIPD
ncbi:hypothetical protein ES703_124876 [subsurface metagenome]